MFRVIPKLSIFGGKTSLRSVIHPQVWMSLQKNVIHFNFSDQSSRVTTAVNSLARTLDGCDNFTDLFFYLHKRDRQLSFLHLSIMVKKFSELHRPIAPNLMLENNYNLILRHVIDQCERTPSLVSPQNVVSIYHHISTVPYSNLITKRCGFILEQTAVSLTGEMTHMDCARFLNGLVKNKKRTFAFGILPTIIQNFNAYGPGTLANILNGLIDLDIKVPELALKLKEDILTTRRKLNSCGQPAFNGFVRFLTQYPDIANDSVLFQRLEDRFSKLGQHYNPQTLVDILNSLSILKQPSMSRGFYSNLAKRLSKNLGKLDNDSLVIIFKTYFKFRLESYLLHCDIVNEILPRLHTMSKSSLVTILFYGSQSSQLSEEIVHKCSQIFLRDGISDLDPVSLEYLVIAYGNFAEVSKTQVANEVKELLAYTLLKRIETMPMTLVEVSIKNLSLFNKESQRLLYSNLEERLMQNELNKANENWHNIYCIANHCLSKLSHMISEQFFSKLIDYSRNFLLSGSVRLESEIEPWKVYAQFLALLSTKELNFECKEHRKNLLHSTDQYFVKFYANKQPLPEILLHKNVLLTIINAFNSAGEKPSTEFEQIFNKALKEFEPNNLHECNLEFLDKGKDLGNEYYINDNQSARQM